MSYRDTYVDDHKYQTSIPDPLPSSYPALWWVISGKFDEEYQVWRITKKSGFLELTFELWKLIKVPVYRLALQKYSNVYRDITAKDFEDAKLQANELIYDALRWNR